MAKDTRLFARLDLDYADHPKIVALSDSAFRAHIEMILYARKYMTDGRVAKQVAKRFASESLSELLANDEEAPSLIANEDGSYQLHGYADMNETKAEIESRSRVNAENGRRGAEAKKRNAKRKSSDSLSKPLSDSSGEWGGEILAETETETDITSGSSDEDTRPDLEEILDYLDRRIEGNNLKKPNRVKSNTDAARRLIDLDKHTVAEVKRIIDYAQSTEFWIPNIRSMSKLRDKWDTLSAQAGFTKPGGQQAFDPWNTKGPF